jgi:late competence protein required for DNA uptake (superfamily II DNA/RNA helicase)
LSDILNNLNFNSHPLTSTTKSVSNKIIYGGRLDLSEKEEIERDVEIKKLEEERLKNVQVLEEFRNGKIQIIVATPTAEEGIDVPSCNLVICYDGIKIEKSFIQMRGRYVVILLIKTKIYYFLGVVLKTVNLLYLTRILIK